MTGAEYTHALASLNLTPDQAAIWLGIGRSTAYRYLKTGCEGAVERALERDMRVRTLEAAIAREMDWLGVVDRASVCRDTQTGAMGRMADLDAALHVRHSDLTAAVGLPG